MKRRPPPAGRDRLWRARSGATAIEFALMLPIFVTISFYGLEAANLAFANLQVSAMAKMIADTASRGGSLDEAMIQQIFFGAKDSTSLPAFASQGRIILSGVQNNAAGTGQYIAWQRCTGALQVTPRYGDAGTGKSSNSLPVMGAAPGIAAPNGGAITFVEVEYQYKPLISARLFGEPRFRTEAAFVVRERTNFSLTNLNNLPASTTTDSCTRYTA